MLNTNIIQINGKVVKWGNSLAIRLSGALREIPNFQQDDFLSITITQDGFSAKKIQKKLQKKPYFSEAELLQGLTPENAHADLVPSAFLDNEI